MSSWHAVPAIQPAYGVFPNASDTAASTISTCGTRNGSSAGTTTHVSSPKQMWRAIAMAAMLAMTASARQTGFAALSRKAMWPTNPVPVDVGTESVVPVLITGIDQKNCEPTAGCSCFIWESLWFMASVPPLSLYDVQCINVTSKLTELRWPSPYASGEGTVLSSGSDCDASDPLFAVTQTLATHASFNTTVCFMADNPYIGMSDNESNARNVISVGLVGVLVFVLYTLTQASRDLLHGHAVFC